MCQENNEIETLVQLHIQDILVLKDIKSVDLLAQVSFEWI